MKHLLAISLLIVFSSFQHTNKTYSLTVKVDNFDKEIGILEIGLYKDPEKFPHVGQTFKMVRIKVEKEEEIFTFVNLEPREYAVCIFHDKNANKVCDRNILGIPTEGYGFSNNIRPRWSVPEFNECATHLNSDKVIRIRLIN